jgi:ribosome recycling factor
MEELFKNCQRKMENSIDHLRQELSKLRTGSANGAILEGIKVDYYGTPTPLNQVATLGVPDSQTITIQPFDISILKDLEKTILASNLGLTPNNDGKIVFSRSLRIEISKGWIVMVWLSGTPSVAT